MDGALALLEGHAHLGWAEGCEIEVHECLPMQDSLIHRMVRVRKGPDSNAVRFGESTGQGPESRASFGFCAPRRTPHLCQQGGSPRRDMTEQNDWDREVIEDFRKNRGRVGGMFEGVPLLLLHTAGAGSGKPRVNLVMYLSDADGWVVLASKGDDPTPLDKIKNLHLVLQTRAVVWAFDKTTPSVEYQA